MAIKLDKIAVKKVGPLHDLTCNLGKFNLFYGHNERGKTFLVEFLIQSLFKNQSRWKGTLRKTSGGGKVSVTGIDSKTVEFEPTSARKIEDYLLDERPGLPDDIVRLMVIKGADAGLDDEGGISKAIVKKLLSSKEVLDIVDSDDNIKKTIKEATVENGTIIGSNRTLIREQTEKMDEIRKLDSLITEMEDLYSGGERQALELKKEELEKRKNDLLNAKRHKAYEIDVEKDELSRLKSEIPEEKLRQISDRITRYKIGRENYSKLEKRLKEAQQKSRNYEWLKQAEEIYKTYIGQAKERPSDAWTVLLALIAITIGVLIYLSLSTAALITFVGFVFFLGFYIHRYREALTYDRVNEEITRVRREFNERVGEQLKNISVLNAKLQQEEGDYKRAVHLKDQLKEKAEELNLLESEIVTGFKELGGKEIPEEEWDETAETLRMELTRYTREITERREILARLDVDPSDYYKEPIDTVYSREALDRCETSLAEVREQIRKNETALSNLKRRICDKTNDEMSTDWEDIIAHLFEVREKRVEEYKELTGQIVGQIAVHQVIKELRKQEDEKIREALESEAVQKPIHQITGRYQKITMRGNELIISDEYSDFPVGDLSTGALEQVLLALRIGFSAHLLKQDQLFLILDDAFQHSDWPSRETIVNQLAELAKEGWQIIYLTMDDHIRELFSNAGKQFGKEYQEVLLEAG